MGKKQDVNSQIVPTLYRLLFTMAAWGVLNAYHQTERFLEKLEVQQAVLQKDHTHLLGRVIRTEATETWSARAQYEYITLHDQNDRDYRELHQRELRNGFKEVLKECERPG